MRTESRSVWRLAKCICLLAAAYPCCCVAQSGVLYSNSALLRASRYGRTSMDRQAAVDTRVGSAVEQNFELDTVDELLVSPQERQTNNSSYRTFFHTYYMTDEAVRQDLYDDDVVSAISQRVAVYELTMTIGDTLARSPVGNVYRSFMDTVKEWREYITLRAGRSSDGGITFDRKASRDHRVLEFRINANVSNGIEPRLRLYDDFLLKYDSIAQATLLEYSFTF